MLKVRTHKATVLNNKTSSQLTEYVYALLANQFLFFTVFQWDIENSMELLCFRFTAPCDIDLSVTTQQNARVYLFSDALPHGAHVPSTGTD